MALNNEPIASFKKEIHAEEAGGEGPWQESAAHAQALH